MQATSAQTAQHRLNNVQMDCTNTQRRWHAVTRTLTLILGVACACLAWLSGVALAASPQRPKVTVGVQIIHHSAQEIDQWQHWLQGLQHTLPEYRWELAPLPWEALSAAVQAGQLQFAVTSPGHSVALEARFGAVRMASQIDGDASMPVHAVGSAVLVAHDSPWQQLRDLKGQPVAAVAEEAFGGYQVVAAQWRQEGIDAAAGDVPMLFTGYPMEQAVQALLQGRAQAAIVRVCMLEQMVARGVIASHTLRVLPARQAAAAQATTPCQTSSPLYPGWALAALPQTPQALSHAVMVALLTQPSTQSGMRWTVAADYHAVHDVLRTLQVTPYGAAPPVSWGQWLWQYRYAGLMGVVLLALSLGYLRHVEALVKRRTAALTRSLQERDALAQQVAQAREKMDHMGRLSVLGELSATLAHEISHPMASLSNYVTGLRRRQNEGNLPPAQLCSALEAMQDAVQRTTRVLDSVRALARKRVSVQRQAVLWPLVCETVELLQAMSSNTAQALHVKLQCPLELQQVEVVMDALQVQQVLLNLLKNAQDLHCANGHSTSPAVVSLAVGAEPGTVVLAVCDQGPPMAADAVARLFEPFYTTKPDGLGLGLSISRNIAELHGGHLQVRSQGRSGGLCMELVLPLAPSVAEKPVALG